MPNQTPTPTPVLTRAKVLAAASPAPAPFFTATPIPAQPIQVVPAAPKPQIPDSVIQDFTSELVSSFVFDLLSKESFFGVLLQSRDKIVKELAWSTAAEIVDELTKELAVSRYNAAKQVSLFRTIVQEIVDQLVQDVARTESRFITAEMLTLLTEQAERISRFERFGWDRWRFQCHKKRIRLQKRQNNAINIYLNLKGSSLGPSLSSKLSPSKGNKKGMTQDFTPHLKVLEKV